MKKTYIMLLAALAAAVWMPARGQERFDNNQFSVHFGTVQSPMPSFSDHREPPMPITVEDQSSAFPWNVSLRFEHEKMVSDLFGYGYGLSAGFRHTGWNFTIPKGTAFVDNTYLGPTDQECKMYLSMLGFTADGGAYAALHLTQWFEIDATVGLTVSRWWEGMGSKCEYGGFEDESGGGGMDGISGTLLGTFAQLGVKLTFNDDFFFSLSARLSESFNRESLIKGTVDWDGPFYTCRVEAPFASEWMLLAGIGVMIEQ